MFSIFESLTWADAILVGVGIVIGVGLVISFHLKALRGYKLLWENERNGNYVMMRRLTTLEQERVGLNEVEDEIKKEEE